LEHRFALQTVCTSTNQSINQLTNQSIKQSRNYLFLDLFKKLFQDSLPHEIRNFKNEKVIKTVKENDKS